MTATHEKPLTLQQRLEAITEEARQAGYAITYWSPEELEEFPDADAQEMIDLAVQRGNDYLEDFRVDDEEEPDQEKQPCL